MFNGNGVSGPALRRSNRMKAAKYHGMKGREPVWFRAAAENVSPPALAENAHAVQKTTSEYAQEI
jgi:hypothetical protein